MRRAFAIAAVMGTASWALTIAQSQTVAPPSGKSLSATMNVYVFPKEGQKPEQQSTDEAQCYDWAVQNVGTDPFQLSKQKEQQKKEAEQAQKEASQVGKGSGAKGAVGGAAAGALIGAIGGEAGTGAAIGATAGVIAGRRKGASAQKKAQQQAEAQSDAALQATAEQLANFKKAFSVCLEGKNYMVKY